MSWFKKINEINCFHIYWTQIKIHIWIVIANIRMPCSGNEINLQMFGHYQEPIEHFNNHNWDVSSILHLPSSVVESVSPFKLAQERPPADVPFSRLLFDCKIYKTSYGVLNIYICNIYICDSSQTTMYSWCSFLLFHEKK